MAAPLHTPRRFDFEGLVLSLEHKTPLQILATAEAGVVPLLLAVLRARLNRPLLIVVPNAQRLQQVVEGLGAFEGELWPGLAPVLPFEPNDVSPYHDVSPLRQNVQARLAAGYRLNLMKRLFLLGVPVADRNFGGCAEAVSCGHRRAAGLRAQTLGRRHSRLRPHSHGLARANA